VRYLVDISYMTFSKRKKGKGDILLFGEGRADSCSAFLLA